VPARNVADNAFGNARLGKQLACPFFMRQVHRRRLFAGQSYDLLFLRGGEHWRLATAGRI